MRCLLREFVSDGRPCSAPVRQVEIHRPPAAHWLQSGGPMIAEGVGCRSVGYPSVGYPSVKRRSTDVHAIATQRDKGVSIRTFTLVRPGGALECNIQG